MIFTLTLLMATAPITIAIEGDGDCVDADAVVAGVEARLSNPPSTPRSVRLEVARSASGEEANAQVQLEEDGERQLTAASCAALSEQISFVIAVWLEPGLLLRPVPAVAIVPVPPTPADPKTSVSTSTERTEPTDTTTKTGIETGANGAANDDRPWTLAIGAGPSTALGGGRVVTQLADQGDLGWSVGVGVESTPEKQASFSRLVLSNVNASAGLCARMSPMWACGDLEGGALVAVPTAGVGAPSTAVVPWVAAGLRAGIAGRWSSSTSLFGEISLRAPLAPVAIVAGDRELWRTDLLLFALTAGLRFDLGGPPP